MLLSKTILIFLPLTIVAQTCNINSGQFGECISTSTCAGRGGKSEAGHCPGAADIQCCTYGTCNNNGVAGSCIPSSTCSGGTTTANLCPGPADIQCCTWGSCTNNGVGGICQPESTCGGATTTANLCPGPADIQCCTSDAPSSPPLSASASKPSSSSSPSSGGNHCNGGSPPPVNDATVNLIKSFEGFVAKPAPDPIGLPTVGYGHLCKSTGCAEVKYPFPLTETTAAELLQDDLKSFEGCVAEYLDKAVKLNDNQYGALCSWAFNDGCGNVQSSTLIKRLNNGEDPDTVAAEELPQWDRAGGSVLPGLTRRRAAEVALFKTPSGVGALPPC